MLLLLNRICRIQWWCSLFPFFWPETPCLSKFGPKNGNCHFELKFGTYINLNMRNSIVVFTFSVLYRKHSFGAYLVQQIKLVSLSWNLVPRLIWTCRIQWWLFTFPALYWKLLFLLSLQPHGSRNRQLSSTESANCFCALP